LPAKFGIDKRIITLSALVMSGEISRDQALMELKQDPYNQGEMQYDKTYVLKKIGMTDVEFEECFSRPNKFYYDYPSYMFLLKNFNKLSLNGLKKVLPFIPSIIIENNNRG
jgi:hypothetical protein